MKILGIDPGTRIVGYGLISPTGNFFSVEEFGYFKIDKKLQFYEKLKLIFDDISDLIARTSPDVAAVEEAFVSQNAKTALRLGHARGVIMLAAANAGMVVAEYSPREIKQAVLGFGNASKQQIQKIVVQLLKISENEIQEDAADGLAVALCHGMRSEREKKYPEMKI
ncbi:crossover junction endodeoxyribonuclease RuvC [bacterium]|nr:crossover junction endodeoxyribonuclease RuvC [bacterium]